MNYASSVAERALLSVDHFLNQAMTFAWTSTLERRCPGERRTMSAWRLPPTLADHDGRGDIRSVAAIDDERSLA